MKKSSTILFLGAMLISLLGCSNDGLEEIASVETNTSDAISLDSLVSLSNTNALVWNEVSPFAKTRTSYDMAECTVYGYTTKSSTGNKKVAIGKDLASAMGIYNQIYIMETVTLNYKITVSGLESNDVIFSSSSSPNCGLDPSSISDLTIGYSSSTNGNDVTMQTKLYHVICDLSGISYDKWYPREPDDVVWNYLLLTKQS